MLLAAARRLSSEKTGVECLQVSALFGKTWGKATGNLSESWDLNRVFSSPAKKMRGAGRPSAGPIRQQPRSGSGSYANHRLLDIPRLPVTRAPEMQG
jgi:hypothetical protein